MDIKTTMLAFFFAFSALVQGHDLSPKFIRGAIERGVPTVEEHFIGLTWPCHRGHRCWAGNVIIHGSDPELATGRTR